MGHADEAGILSRSQASFAKGDDSYCPSARSVRVDPVGEDGYRAHASTATISRHSGHQSAGVPMPPNRELRVPTNLHQGSGRQNARAFTSDPTRVVEHRKFGQVLYDRGTSAAPLALKGRMLQAEVLGVTLYGFSRWTLKQTRHDTLDLE